ncbi:MAG: hypothetical protein KAW41_05790 [Candidatus Diapherotrites archaeon]|nr:hypothetical protein [Candidatus Diapherotrites archaeon]
MAIDLKKLTPLELDRLLVEAGEVTPEMEDAIQHKMGEWDRQAKEFYEKKVSTGKLDEKLKKVISSVFEIGREHGAELKEPAILVLSFRGGVSTTTSPGKARAEGSRLAVYSNGQIVHGGEEPKEGTAVRVDLTQAQRLAEDFDIEGTGKAEQTELLFLDFLAHELGHEVERQFPRQIRGGVETREQLAEEIARQSMEKAGFGIAPLTKALDEHNEKVTEFAQSTVEGDARLEVHNEKLAEFTPNKVGKRTRAGQYYNIHLNYVFNDAYYDGKTSKTVKEQKVINYLTGRLGHLYEYDKPEQGRIRYSECMHSQQGGKIARDLLKKQKHSLRK